MTIQSTIESLVIPRIEKLVKESVVIGDNHGRAILTELNIPMNVPPSQVLFTMKFRYSYVDEWANDLAILTDDIDKYPFLFINARGVTYEGDIVTVPEMVIATRTEEDLKVADSDALIQNPILANLMYYLEDSLQVFCGTESDFSLKTEKVYNAKLNSTALSQNIDAVLIKNTKLRLIKNCKK